MNQRTLLTLTLLSLVSLLFLHTPRNPAEAQDRPRPGWEYRVFRMDPAEYRNKQDYREILQQHDGNATQADSAFQERVLNFLGDEGWELVDVERPRVNLVHIYLKRALVR